jgi:glucose/mannose transport system substrate-binding protein
MTGLLKCIGLTSIVALGAACGGSSGSGTSTTMQAGTGQLEVFTWWTTGGNAAAVSDETTAYKTTYPNVSLINGFQAGGGGTVANQILSMRMANNNPPDIFQTHGGDGILRTWVRPAGVADHSQNKVADLTELYQAQGWDKVIYPSVLASMTDQGGIYAMPLSVHKENGIFYNKKVFADNNLTLPTTMAEFLTVCQTLEAKGIIPITIGLKDAFSITMIFTNLLLMEANTAHPGMGYQWLAQYWAGKQPQADDPVVVAAVNDLPQLVPYMNPDRATLGYAQAAQKLANGTAAMQMMGDWMAGLLSLPTSKGGYALTPVTDFDLTPFPGTADTFVLVIDAWAMPQGIAAQDNANALAYLALSGSAAVSTKFAIDKNCVPPRSDIDKTQLPALAQRAFGEFSTLHVVTSMANGVATPVGYESNVQAALVQFMSDGNTASVIAALKSNYPLLSQ